MKMTVKKIGTREDRAFSSLWESAIKIMEYYDTGGDPTHYGISPIDSAVCYFFPNFTAVFTGDTENVDEWEAIAVTGDESRIDVSCSFL